MSINRYKPYVIILPTAHRLDREHTPKELASDKNIVKAIAAIDAMFDVEERQVYEVRLQEYTDVASIIASGAEKNIAKGVEKASKAIVLNMAGKGIALESIAELTGLSVSDIAALLQSTSEQGCCERLFTRFALKQISSVWHLEEPENRVGNRLQHRTLQVQSAKNYQSEYSCGRQFCTQWLQAFFFVMPTPSFFDVL